MDKKTEDAIAKLPKAWQKWVSAAVIVVTLVGGAIGGAVAFGQNKEALTSAVAHNTTSTETLTKWVETHKETSSNIEARIEVMQTQTQQVDKTLATHTERLNALASDVGEIKGLTKAMFEMLKNREK